ncbi:uncharacterized protein LOC119652492 isoform X2 [Hermetia illucens]|uniref:uncharacterized protein LOC119652492 isoform X2 n=1 Tax=Hermetia illucens TaxID=343691 RepID=UPI0018CC287E|nr:uncharacterized protein LOC119652492 isoform X2 [Hermetia illucens]
MEIPGSSNKDGTDENNYMENEAKKVRIYIDELRSRLVELQNEGEDLKRTAETFLGGESVFPDDLDTTPDQATPPEPILPNSFSIDKTPVIREEPEEIRLLREQSGNIREKIKLIQSRLERVNLSSLPATTNNKSPSMETFVEHETRTQLYEAAANTLKKVNAFEEDITSVESSFKNRPHELPIELTKDRKMRTTNY